MKIVGFLSVEMAADELHVHAESVRRYLKSGELKGTKFAGAWHISRPAFNAFKRDFVRRSKGRPAGPQPPAPPPAPPRQMMAVTNHPDAVKPERVFVKFTSHEEPGDEAAAPRRRGRPRKVQTTEEITTND